VGDLFWSKNWRSLEDTASGLEGRWSGGELDKPPLPMCNIMYYALSVIRSFRHRGIESFFGTGPKAGMQPKHEARLRILLTTLNLASTPPDMNRSGWDWHPLKGELKGHWSVKVNGNGRLTFAFEGEDAILVDDHDYH